MGKILSTLQRLPFNVHITYDSIEIKKGKHEVSKLQKDKTI